VALERASIEKNDFPVGRRGYDPAAVDSHLRAIADEVEELTRSARRRTDNLSSAASEQVRAIIEAAEKSAAEIQQKVQEEARQIRAEARRDARKELAEATADVDQEREHASAQAREYVEKVSAATSQMLQRLESVDTDLTGLTESLRAGSTRLKDELDVLESELRDLSGVAQPPALGESKPEGALEPEAPWFEQEEPGLAEEPEPREPVEAEAAVIGTGDDAEGARLIALNMALNGTPRDETDRYLAENFDLSDRGRLLDEVYASVEG
jgi:cell division septum initiation protein DivIVA